MSSSSLSSKQDSCSNDDNDYLLNNALVSDIERFATFAERLRRSLNPLTNVSDGESMCVAVHSALSMVSQSVRDLLVRYPSFKTTQVLLPTSQLIHNVKELNFDNSNVDVSPALACLDKLEAAVGSTLKQNLRRPNLSTTKYSSVTLGHKVKNGCDGGLKNARLLTRRHSAFQPKGRDSLYVDVDEMDRMVTDRIDGIDIAFDRGKAWAKYCKDLLNYVSRRTQLEVDHAKRVQNLANQSKIAIGEHYLPLKDIFESAFENDLNFCEQTYETVKHIQDKFIKSLEMRREEHERQRRALKNEWLRINKQVKDTQQELHKARALLGSRDDGYRKAQENFIRTESTGPAVGSELVRRRKELDRRRRNEEDALNKRDDAQNQVQRLQLELERRQQQLDDAKIRIVSQLRELVYRCDQTTKACTTHYFQALANLCIPQPGKYHEFADATRNYIPGAEYMSYLQNLPRRTASSGSLYRTDNGDRVSSSNHTASSSSVCSQRRNAIDMLDQEVIIDKKQKKSTVRLLEQAAMEGFNTDAARSHKLQRTRQPTKCSQCEALSLLSTVQCTQCGMTWHKSCLPRISVFCGQDDKTNTDSSVRRTSIFGVALQNHLNSQNRPIPIVLEKCVDELQRRGLKVKGLYRTCGVKSKIEQICEDFERSASDKNVNLSIYHPMNIASVIKLYLRKLPEPLLTHELYEEWISLAEKNLVDLSIVNQIKLILKKLPSRNVDSLKFLLLHLNRVTWFEMDNLMTASNLGAVISPSMVWKNTCVPHTSNSAFLSNAHLMSKSVEILIKHAFEIFDVDLVEDRREFFEKYAGIDEPSNADIEIEDRLCEGEADDDLLDDDADAICSSYMPQPPTPDLLKNTSRNKSESFSISDDVEFESSSGSARASGSSQANIQLKAHKFPPRLASHQVSPVRIRQRGDKKRSYTTSILVSPHPERRLILPQKQRSMEEKKSFSVCSGDVTVDVNKGQFYLPTNSDESVQTTNRGDILMNLCRRLNQNTTDDLMFSSSKPVDREHNIPEVHSARAALFQEADASYI